jgi:ribosomal protein S12 methylthiotransferase accessory factor YcaO
MAFLLEQKPCKSIRSKTITDTFALNKILNILKKRKYHMYMADITLLFLQKYDVKTYRSLVPELQPLYLNEQDKEYSLERISEAQRYYKASKKTLNTLPHPFI